ncbi:hypothetical protein CXB51_030045 [Gossypium anomalum]|uniref:DC1 domain-containing protein n=1 Tax=Gossypium anomalum TaxID=47600 RepID=A0A8J5XXS8_9ROSI|nr:hypothetical protein CXB51_030045 [Gossypium anomalum]
MYVEKTIGVQHFSQGNLVLEDKMKEDNDRPCDGCMLPISAPSYHCSKCNFSLHKTCAELSRISTTGFNETSSTLKPLLDRQWCHLCGRYSSGLLYTRRHFCLKCCRCS